MLYDGVVLIDNGAVLVGVGDAFLNKTNTQMHCTYKIVDFHHIK
jgi:hypothetical protein